MAQVTVVWDFPELSAAKLRELVADFDATHAGQGEEPIKSEYVKASDVIDLIWNDDLTKVKFNVILDEIKD